MPIRILLIEDNEVDQWAFEELVTKQQLQYYYIVVNSFTAAKKQLASERFDVVISNYLMSDGTIFEHLDLIVEIPIIMVTGSEVEANHVRMKDPAIFAVFVKSIGAQTYEKLPLLISKAVEKI